MKLLSKIGDFALRALALCMLVAFWLVGGWLVGRAVPTLIIGSFYFVGLDTLGDRLVALLPDSRVALETVSTATGVLVILCYRLVSRAWERKQAIEEEIKLVTEIQIVEPLPPGPVERFFAKDGPADRLFDKCFGSIENLENDRARYAVGFIAWTAVALPLGGVAMWLQRAQFRPLTPWEAIPLAFLYGSVLNFLILLALAGVGWAARNVRAMRTWMEGKLPRKVILPYRSWQLRHMARNRRQTRR